MKYYIKTFYDFGCTATLLSKHKENKRRHPDTENCLTDERKAIEKNDNKMNDWIRKNDIHVLSWESKFLYDTDGYLNIIREVKYQETTGKSELLMEKKI